MNIKKDHMKIYYEIPENRGRFIAPVVTIGNFDGVHLGHRQILSTLKNRAQYHCGTPFVVTFRNHPRTVIHPGATCRMITTVEEKQKYLFESGIENIIMLDFTKELSQLSAREFYNNLLIEKLGVKEIVIGYDHAFGKNREGNIDFLNKLSAETGVLITQVKEETVGNETISSTILRKEIDCGNMEKVENLLGRHYTLTGRVVRGEGRGKNLGFPTANILPDYEDKMIPGYGVYAVKVFVNTVVCNGMLNIGNNPTFGAKNRSIEVNILDFKGDLYGEKITVEFIKRIRDEIKFESPEALVEQIQKDEAAAREILA
jgi:riboflavin kinase/FMN adenylyltransferase